MCDNAAWLDSGTLRGIGPVDEVVWSYLDDVHKKRMEHSEEQIRKASTKTENRWGSQEVEITRFEMVDDTGQSRSVFRTGENLRDRISYKARRRVEKPVFGFVIFRPDGLACTGSTTRLAKQEISSIEEGEGTLECRVDDLTLLMGSYLVTAYIYNDSLLLPYDHHEKMYELKIIEGKYDNKWCVYHLPAEWHHLH